MKKVAVKRIKKSKRKIFTKKKKFIVLLFKICSDLNIKNSQEEIKNFLNKDKRND